MYYNIYYIWFVLSAFSGTEGCRPWSYPLYRTVQYSIQYSVFRVVLDCVDCFATCLLLRWVVIVVYYSYPVTNEWITFHTGGEETFFQKFYCNFYWNFTPDWWWMMTGKEHNEHKTYSHWVIKYSIGRYIHIYIYIYIHQRY